MPELPEVEVYRRYFERHALRQKIGRVRVVDERIPGDVSVLRGRSFRKVRRHGKHLFAEAGDVWLHLHFGMTGDLAYYRGEDPRFARVIFDFTNGAHLAFEDMRRFGVADLTPSPEAYISEHHLGPDPLEMSLREFRGILAQKHGAVKALLMSQNVIAGIGNLYADETLFQTSINPRRKVDTLSSDEVRRMYAAMCRILRTPRRKLPREEGARCPRCGGAIRRTVVSGRTTYFCAKHQKR